MPAFVVRVWMPDRPGALGAVASRIGAVRGDVVGVEIIEQGAGRAVDELVVELPDAGLIDLLVAEVGQVDGVDVEHVRSLGGSVPDPGVAALEAAAALQAAPDPAALFEVATGACTSLLAVDWAAAVIRGADGPQVVACIGEGLPGDGWITAFVAGATTVDVPLELQDVALAPLPTIEGALVMARAEVPLRGRERDLLAALARFVEARHATLSAHA